MSTANNNTPVPSYVANGGQPAHHSSAAASTAASNSGSTPVMTFQHAPYGYSAVPEQFRTIQAVTPPRTPPMAPQVPTVAHAPSDSLGPLGEAQSSTTSFDLAVEGGEHPEPMMVMSSRTRVDYTPYPQQPKPQRRNSGNNSRSAMLPPPVQHLCPPRGGSGDMQNFSATMYDQSGMPPPAPPSYTVSLHSGANPCSPTFPPAMFPNHPNRPMPLTKAYPVEKEDELIAAMAQKDGLDVEAAKKRMFVAHHHLEKTETPYYQMPFGKTGKLPTPAHWPSHCSIDGSSMYPNTYRAFIGQVRFETTTEQIAWVLERVAGVTAAFVAYHRNGCFVAHFLTEEECDTAVSYHKQILFDLHGVWNLKSANSSSSVEDQHHAQLVGEALRNKPNLHKYRLPKGCMVIERFTSTRSSTGMPAFPNTAALQPSPCHPVPARAPPVHTGGRKMSHLTIHQQLPAKSNNFDAIDVVSIHCRGNSM